MLEHVDTVLSFAVVMLLLSLLVTTIVQTAVAALALRSKILKMGIERLLKQVDPNLAEHAAKIAAAVVCHPAVAAGKSGTTDVTEEEKPCTTDIKKGELVQLLNDLVTSPTSIIKGQPAQDALKKALGFAVLPEAQALADSMQAELIKTFSAEAEVAKIKKIVEQVTESSRQIAANVTTWFDTVIDRTTDEFRKWTRMITIICAVALAFLFHVDSLVIFRQLASDPELRAKLMQKTDAALDTAAEVFSLQQESRGLASTALQQACNAHPKIAATYAIKDIPAECAKYIEGEAWLRGMLEKSKNPNGLKVLPVAYSSRPAKRAKDPNDPQVLLDDYQKRFDELATANWQGCVQRAKKVKASLDESTLALFSIPDHWWDIREYWGMHFWGTLMTAIFLSLGAPFWYNALKQLSNLRPAIAQKVDQASQPPKQS